MDLGSPSTRTLETDARSADSASQFPYRWHHKVLGVLFVVLYFELGVFLLVFPWSSYWDVNYFSSFSPAWREFWVWPYFRGAVSGLGMVNIYLSFLEVFRLQRFSRPAR